MSASAPAAATPGVDLVLPAYNEAAILPGLFANLAAQVDADGQPLPRGSWRLVLVDNASTDGTATLARDLASRPASPETLVVEAPKKGVVEARIRGSEFVLRSEERRRFPLVVHGDADNLFPPAFIHTVSRRLAAGDIDVLSWVGYTPLDFWRRVPAVARRQYDEIGTLNFDDETLRHFGFDETRALFTQRIFADFRFVPHQCGLGMTKEILSRAGGYRHEIWPDGTELLGEARNLLYRLAWHGANLDYIRSPAIVLNPRRLLGETEKVWAGRAYTEGMSDLRQPASPACSGPHSTDLANRTDPSAAAYANLDRLAPRLTFQVMRRNLVQRHILDACIARPTLLAANRRYFGAAHDDIRDAVQTLHASRQTGLYIEVRPLSDSLLDRHLQTILDTMRRQSAVA